MFRRVLSELSDHLTQFHTCETLITEDPHDRTPKGHLATDERSPYGDPSSSTSMAVSSGINHLALAHLLLSLAQGAGNYSRFFARRFLEETPPGEDTAYVALWLTFKF